MMRAKHRQKESGVALLLSILALLLLSAIAVSMMYMSSTESAVNANLKAEETQYFAARAGIEEIRDRMIPGVAPYSINGLAAGPNPPCPGDANCYLPTQLPTSVNGQVVYMLQAGVSTDSVFNFASATGCPSGQPGCMADDELCHDYAIGGMAKSAQQNVRCTVLPGGNGGAWYSIPGSGIGAIVAANGLPENSPGVSAAPNWPLGGNPQNPLNWKWARITLKANNSTPYCVDGTCALGAVPVCWDGISEKPLTAANCAAMPIPANPVYLVTALAVSNAGARRIVQVEVAQTPPTTGQPGGLFATGMGCGALTFSGNSNTHSFNSALENPPTAPPSNASNTNGDVGANGGIAVNGTAASINGNVASTLPPGTTGCPATAISKTGNPTIASESQLGAPFTAAVPTIPSHVPTTTLTNPTTLAPGTYGNVSLTAHTTLTLQGGTPGNPAIYNFNSITEAGQGSIAVTGPVIINLAGQGVTTVLDLTGGSFSNSTNVPSNLTINYGGTEAITMKGNSQAFFVLNAPLANLTLNGTSAFYGQATAATISVQGTPDFYWDRAALTQPPVNTSPFVEIAMRELSY